MPRPGSYSYIDPGQLSKGPDYDPFAPPLSLVTPGSYGGGEGWGTEITPERQDRNAWESALARGTEPGLEEMLPQLDLAMLFTAPGVPQALGRAVSNFAPSAGRIAGRLPGLGNEAGFINWPSGHAYSDAFLHRSLSADELPFLERIFLRGRSTEAPTTMVMPNMLTVFQNEPRGLMFNVENPKTVKFAAPYDLNSEPFVGNFSTKTPAVRWKPQDPYKQTAEEWRRQPLGDILLESGDRAGWPDIGDTSHVLQHSEIIPEINRDMLAGVRLPWGKADLGGITDLDRFARSIRKSPDEVIAELTQRQSNLDEPFRRFADKFKLPIYRWPVDWNAGQQAKMLENPFAGNWVNKGDYITSSEVEELLRNMR